jgi:large subunit ribosomal protein L17
MRHGVKTNNLGRKIGHRVALMKNLASALVSHKRINTTLAKAKVLRVFLEPLITKSKNNTQHSRRTVFSYLMNKEAVTELFEVIAPKVMDRPGGYLRIIKTGFRKGDGAEMAMIEFVDFNEVYKVENKTAVKKKTRRSKTTKTIAASQETKETIEESTESIVESTDNEDSN